LRIYLQILKNGQDFWKKFEGYIIQLRMCYKFGSSTKSRSNNIKSSQVKHTLLL